MPFTSIGMNGFVDFQSTSPTLDSTTAQGDLTDVFDWRGRASSTTYRELGQQTGGRTRTGEYKELRDILDEALIISTLSDDEATHEGHNTTKPLYYFYFSALLLGAY